MIEGLLAGLLRRAWNISATLFIWGNSFCRCRLFRKQDVCIYVLLEAQLWTLFYCSLFKSKSFCFLLIIEMGLYYIQVNCSIWGFILLPDGPLIYVRLSDWNISNDGQLLLMKRSFVFRFKWLHPQSPSVMVKNVTQKSPKIIKNFNKKQ